MTEAEFQTVRGAGFLLALALAVVAQHLSPHARLAGSWRVNGAFWVVDALLIGGVCGACACSVARWSAAQGFGIFQQVAVSPWLTLVATIVLLDMVSYFWHRANHTIPLLWRFHRVHHSDPAFTATTALRFHPGELLLSLPVRLAAVALLGAAPVAVVIFEIVFAMANFFEHSDINLHIDLERWLARFCITPALHRRHHSRQWEELNSNFGTVFVVWDRVLGTYKPSSSALWIETGLPDRSHGTTLREMLLLPFLRQGG